MNVPISKYMEQKTNLMFPFCGSKGNSEILLFPLVRIKSTQHNTIIANSTVDVFFLSNKKMHAESSPLHEACTFFANKEYKKAYDTLSKAPHSSQQLHNTTLLLHGFVEPNYDALFKELEQIAPKITEPKTSDLLQFNQAILCVQFRRFETATKILQPLRQKLDKMDENLAIRTCFTLLEVLFRTAAPSAQEINFLLDFVEKRSKKTSSTTTTSPDSLQLQQQQLNPQDIKLAYHLYKFRWHALQHDVQAAEKELALASALNKNKVATYQAQLAFLKSEQAFALLVQPSDGNDEQMCAYWNNIACLMNKQSKYHAAYLCFTKAYTHAMNSSGMMRHNMLLSCLNNMALSLLTHLKRPLDAYHCFCMLVQDKPNSAKYWIRLAECCIAASKQKENVILDYTVIKNQVGHAQYVRLPSSTPNQLHEQAQQAQQQPSSTMMHHHTTTTPSSVNTSISSPSLVNPPTSILEQDKLFFQSGPSLTMAEKCLKNALSLAANHTSDMIFIYCKLAYVYLLLEDPSLCVYYAYKILKSKSLQQHHAMNTMIILQLVMYASEALCTMDKYAEAMQLIQAHLQEANSEQSYTIHAIVTCIMNGQVDKAQLMLKSLPPSKHATLLQIYIHMFCGNKQALWNMFHTSS